MSAFWSSTSRMGVAMLLASCLARMIWMDLTAVMLRSPHPRAGTASVLQNERRPPFHAADKVGRADLVVVRFDASLRCEPWGRLQHRAQLTAIKLGRASRAVTGGVFAGGDQHCTAVLDAFDLAIEQAQFHRVALVVRSVNGEHRGLDFLQASGWVVVTR